MRSPTRFGLRPEMLIRDSNGVRNSEDRKDGLNKDINMFMPGLQEDDDLLKQFLLSGTEEGIRLPPNNSRAKSTHVKRRNYLN